MEQGNTEKPTSETNSLSMGPPSMIVCHLICMTLLVQKQYSSPFLLFRNREYAAFKTRHTELSRREVYKLYACACNMIVRMFDFYRNDADVQKKYKHIYEKEVILVKWGDDQISQANQSLLLMKRQYPLFSNPPMRTSPLYQSIGDRPVTDTKQSVALKRVSSTYTAPIELCFMILVET